MVPPTACIDWLSALVSPVPICLFQHTVGKRGSSSIGRGFLSKAMLLGAGGRPWPLRGRSSPDSPDECACHHAVLWVLSGRGQPPLTFASHPIHQLRQLPPPLLACRLLPAPALPILAGTADMHVFWWRR